MKINVDKEFKRGCYAYFADRCILKGIDKRQDINQLFYLLCTVTTEEGYTLINTLDNVKAVPNGMIDEDIVKPIRRDSNLRESWFTEKLVERLLELNAKVFEIRGFNLVELIRSYFSHRYYYSKAQHQMKSSYPVPVEVIKNERRYYTWKR